MIDTPIPQPVPGERGAPCEACIELRKRRESGPTHPMCKLVCLCAAVCGPGCQYQTEDEWEPPPVPRFK